MVVLCAITGAAVVVALIYPPAWLMALPCIVITAFMLTD
jgi:hypothetical protein